MDGRQRNMAENIRQQVTRIDQLLTRLYDTPGVTPATMSLAENVRLGNDEIRRGCGLCCSEHDPCGK